MPEATERLTMESAPTNRITIRPANGKDIPPVLKLMREFSKESLEEYGFEVNPEHCLEVFKQYVDSSLVAESDGEIVGVLAGFISSYALDGSKVFNELVWFVKKDNRTVGVAMIYAIESMCRRIGVKHIVMACMSNSKHDKIAKFYQDHGYKHLETHYIKQIGE